LELINRHYEFHKSSPLLNIVITIHPNGICNDKPITAKNVIVISTQPDVTAWNARRRFLTKTITTRPIPIEIANKRTANNLPPKFGPLLMLDSPTEMVLGPRPTLPEPEVCSHANCAV
jgi:hypothetical protein